MNFLKSVKLKFIVLSTLMFTSSFLLAETPRFPLPKTADQVWQNDLDLNDKIDFFTGLNTVSLSTSTINTTPTTTTSTSFVDTALTSSTTIRSSSHIKITVMSVAGIGTNAERAIFTIQRNHTTDFAEMLNLQFPVAPVYTPINITWVDQDPGTTPNYTLRIKSSGGGTVYHNPNGASATMLLEEILNP